MDVVDLVKLGENLFEQDDIKGSRSKFLEALILAPEDPQLHNRLGMLEMSQGNSKKAQVYYTKACELAPEISRYHMRLGDSFQRLGQFEEAIQSYARSLELEPKNAPAWNNRGFANFNINRWNEALRCYDESMRSDPSYAVAWYNYGYTLQLSGRLNDSKDYYQRAVELDPEDKIAWNNLANVHYNQGQYERSIEIYKKSLELDSEYVIAVNNIGNALDHLHRYEESIPYHEKAIELDSTFHYAWMAKGRALTSLNRPEEGLEYLETSIELDSEDPDYYEALCRCYMSLNFLDKAREIINLGLSLDGQHVPCWMALGDINFELGNKMRALQCYDEAVSAQDILSRNRMRDLDWIEKGRILEKAGVTHESFRQYTNAISVASETSRPYFKKAEVLIDYDRFQDAKKLILDGLSRDPDSITGHKLLIQVMEPSEIIEELDTKFSKFSNNHEIASLLAYKLVDIEPKIALDFLADNNFSDLILKVQCLKNMEKINEAFDFAKKAINISPKKIDGWISAGWCLYDLENFEDADSYFEAALGIDISNPDALLGKALILKSKNKDFSYYNKALDAIDPNLVI
jgi:tetratricopeptide (TPR) repeat protein